MEFKDLELKMVHTDDTDATGVLYYGDSMDVLASVVVSSCDCFITVDWFLKSDKNKEVIEEFIDLCGERATKSIYENYCAWNEDFDIITNVYVCSETNVTRIEKIKIKHIEEVENTIDKNNVTYEIEKH